MPVKPKNYIIEIIKEIYEAHNICELGFDIIKLCENMGYAVIPYSSLSQKKQEACLNIDYDGFSLYNERKQRCEIYYNDNVYTKNRIKYTISHELGHIELGHVFSENANFEMEEDAVEFARQFCAPQVILYHKDLRTPEKIYEACKVSEKFSLVLCLRLKDRIECYGAKFSENEMNLWNHFNLVETINQL